MTFPSSYKQGKDWSGILAHSLVIFATSTATISIYTVSDICHRSHLYSKEKRTHADTVASLHSTSPEVTKANQPHNKLPHRTGKVVFLILLPIILASLLASSSLRSSLRATASK